VTLHVCLLECCIHITATRHKQSGNMTTRSLSAQPQCSHVYCVVHLTAAVRMYIPLYIYVCLGSTICWLQQDSNVFAVLLLTVVRGAY
jgi:hypothetical protein